MTLAARVSAFFLAALAIILIIVVGALWGFARHNLQEQLQHRLLAGIDALVGSVEIEPHELEWDPAEHRITLGSGDADDRVQWIIRDSHGTVVDRSSGISDAALTALTALSPSEISDPDAVSARLTQTIGEWRVMHHRLRAEHPDQIPPNEPSEPFDYKELTFSGVVSTAPVEQVLRQLALTGTLFAIAVWCLAAMLGRWYCRRALRPLLEMAEEARSITTNWQTGAIAVPASRDELQELGEAFNSLLRRWRGIFERQSSFSASVAHQLRSPLTVMLGELELSLRRPRTVEEQTVVIRRTHEAAERLRRTIEGLLFLTRTDTEHEPPDAVLLDLREWVEEQFRRWQEHERGSDLHLVLRGSGPVHVRGSSVLLIQVLDNLLDNALRYSPAGSPVVIDLDATEVEARLSVQDSGPGILPEDLPHLFELFYRSRAVRRSQPSGTGLGLPLVARIAELHDGRVEVTSRLQQGSRFTLHLPRAERVEPVESLAAVDHH